MWVTKRSSSLALKPRADATRSPKQEYQWPHKRDNVLQKFKKKNLLNFTDICREEGLVPYIPELPRMFEATINYNRSVYNVRKIHTAPAGLESTCLVLAYGLGKCSNAFSNCSPQ